MWDISGESTNMPVFCKMLILHQGACLVNSPAVLTRDAAIQIGDDFISIPLTERSLGAKGAHSVTDKKPEIGNLVIGN
jgi:hypothetical protein